MTEQKCLRCGEKSDEQLCKQCSEKFYVRKDGKVMPKWAKAFERD